MLTNLEKTYFLSLFNRGGYVLDFSTSSFDAFTSDSIGEALCQKYGYSKGRSLDCYIRDSTVSERNKSKLLLDLLAYYKKTEEYYDEVVKADPSLKKYKSLYGSCAAAAERIAKEDAFTPIGLSEIANELNGDYLQAQIKLMQESSETNPTVAIGKSKELVESVCKTILEKDGVIYERNWTLNKLVRETMAHLEVLPSNIDDEAKASKALKSILGSLGCIAGGMVELRNAYGDGHGKSESFQALQPRHAKLAVGAASTLVFFLWQTYKIKH